MSNDPYQQEIVDYYRETENAYKDSWDLEKSLAIHYGYSDKKAQTFSKSLLRMNEVMMEAAAISPSDSVLDSGCGIGGSGIYLAEKAGCKVTGITLSSLQADQARKNAVARGLDSKLAFQVMDYSCTEFDDETFDVVWGCESICYASDKEKFIREAYRVLKPGGRLVVADGFVSFFENNSEPVIRKWLEGWKVNYLETPGRFTSFMINSGFREVEFSDISENVYPSSVRLYRFYFLAKAYLIWKRIRGGKPPTGIQVKNIDACKFQYLGLKRKYWQYGIIVGRKPGKQQ